MTLLAGHEDPATVTAENVERVAARLADEIVAAATAVKDSAAYDWWKVLFALYPNSKATHARRDRDPARLMPDVVTLFGAEPVEGVLRPCTFCGRLCGAVWSKRNLPMFDSDRALNTVPPGVAGWPVCRACRVALWALPYGAWVTAGSATVLTCEDLRVERAFCARNVVRASRIRQLGFDGLPASAGPEAITLRALREHAEDSGTATTLWMFKNDNQEPWLRTSSTRRGVVVFQRRMLADPDCRRGWNDLKGRMTRRDRAGKVMLDGTTAVARTLFDRDGERTDRLLRELRQRCSEPDTVPATTLRGWRELCCLYLEVMYGMDVSRLRPATELLTEWISWESTRGRFNEYRKAAGNSYELHKLLMTASARLYLDGAHPADITQVTPHLLADGAAGWRLRAQLFFEVVAALQNAGVTVGKPDEQASEDEAPVSFSGGPGDDDDEDGYA